MKETETPKIMEWCVYICIAAFFFVLGLAIQAKVSVKLVPCDSETVKAIQEEKQ